MVVQSQMDSNQAFATIRKFLNGAVYIESSISPKRDEKHHAKPPQSTTIKKRISCSCLNEHLCKIHENVQSLQESFSNIEICSYHSETSFSEENNKATNSSITDFKTTHTSTTSLCHTNGEDKDKQTNFKNWMCKKIEEKKKFSETQALLFEKQQKEKQKRLEQERKNFKRWLVIKKMEQKEKERIEKEKLLQEHSVKQQQKTRRSREAELTYKLWCKRKEQEELEKQLEKKVSDMKLNEEKQQRLEENEQAYQNWLKNSVNKPMPIPLNRGLETLRSSVSVTYINPEPWKPNIEDSELNSANNQ